MKKNKLLRAVIALTLALISVVAVTAMAAEYTADDGMTFQIVTSKKEYGVNEEVQIILLAKNYNQKMKMANISWEATVPGEELTFISGDLSGAQAVEVGERAAINLRLMKVVETEENPPVEEPDPTPTEPVQGVEEKDTTGSTIVLILLIVLALAAIGAMAYLLIKRRGVTACIALLLTLGMVLPCIPAVDVSAAELNIGDMIMGDNNTLNASIKFIVDGKEYEATATMTYEMTEQKEIIVEAFYSSMSKNEWSKHNAPIVTPTIGEHPRLMFTQEDIPGIIKTLEAEECAGFAKEFYRLLGITFNGAFGEPRETVDENGNVVIEGNFSHDKLNSIRVKALYYALFKNSDDAEKAHMAQYYGKTAVRAMRKGLETIYFNPNDPDPYRKGDVVLATAEVYDWCYDLLTHEDKQALAAGAQKAGSTTEAGWPLYLGTADDTVVGHMGGNLIQTYWVGLGIAVYDEYPSMFEVVGGSYFQNYIEARNEWNVSGHHHQGASYGAGGRGDADLTAQYLIFAMTGGDNDRDGDGVQDGLRALEPESFHSLSYGLLYMLRPDGQFFREGDTWEENQTNKGELWDANAVHFERASNFFKDGILRRVAMELDDFNYSGTDFMYLLVTHDTDVQTKSYSTLPYTKYFKDPTGAMTARTGWDMGIASNDVIAKMNISTAFVGNHQHHDAGSFQIYYKGILASESGYYTTVSDPHYEAYLTTSIAHNTLAITSVQNRYGKQTAALTKNWGVGGNKPLVNKVTGHEFGPNTYKPEYSYLAGDIAGSYDANVQEAVRSMLFLNLELDGNTEHPGAFIVFDQIKTSQVGSKKSFLLHMQSEPEVDGNTIIIKNTAGDYNGMLTDQVLYVGTASKADSAYTIDKLGGPGKQFLVGAYNYAHKGEVTSMLCQEQGWGRVEITTTTTQENQTDYMLNVMYVGDADGNTKVVPAKLIYDGKGVIMGAQLMNHVAMFNMDGNHRIEKEVSFTIPQNDGYKTFKVNMAGLKAGTWTVYVNGKAAGKQIASEDGGMIYFEAAAGTIKLVRSGSESNKTFDETPITEEEPIGIMINNFYYYTDAHPVASGDDYLIPVCMVFDALNGKGTWNRDHTKYTVTFEGATYELTSNSITKDGEAVQFKEIRPAAGDLLVDITTVKSMVEDSVIYYDRFVNRVRITLDAAMTIPELSDEIIFEYPTAVQVEAVIDKGYSTLPLTNTLDGDPTTRWTSQNSGNNVCDAIFDFGKVVPLTDIMIMFWAEESLYSDYVFDIQVSVDGAEWIAVYEKTKSGEINPKTFMETYLRLPMNDEARYVRIIGHGRHRYTNSGRPNPAPDNGWTIISEIIFLQKSIIDPDGADINGGKLLAEAECFNKQDTVETERNNKASGKESVITKVGYTTNPGSVAATKPQLWATFIPKTTGVHYIWARVNTSKVTSGDTLWVNIEGVTGNSYYAEKVNVGKKDSDGFHWIKLGQYEEQVTSSPWKAGQEYTLSVISGCKGLVIDCFMVALDASYVPYGDPYSKKTDTNGVVSVDGKDTIYEHSMAKPSGTDAKLQSINASGSVNQAYIDYVLSTKNLPGELVVNIVAGTSGLYSVWATVKAPSSAEDKFFYAISTNDSDYKYLLGDLSEMTTVEENGYLKVKLGDIEVQASESLFVRIKTCSKGVSLGKITTTCDIPKDVNKLTGGKITLQAEDAKLQKAGEETLIIDTVDPNRYWPNDVVKIVDSTGAAGGKAVQFMKTNTAWNHLMFATSEATPHMSFRVMPDQDGEYYIWAKVYAPKDTGIYAWIEGGDDYYFWRQPLNWETYSVDGEDYYWVRMYQEAKTGKTLTREHLYNWTAQRIYTINFRGMYSGVKVDEIFVTNNPKDAPHNHKFGESWSADATHHWYAVTCGCTDVEPRYYSEHFFEDHTDKECNTCGYKNPNYAPHNYVDNKCTICGGLAPFKTSGGKLTLEAENLMLAPDDKENHIPTHLKKPVVKVVEQSNASGGKAVQFLKTNSGWNSFVGQGTTPIPHISALVTPDKSGQYYIWVKVYAPANADYGAKLYAYIEGGSDVDYWRQPLDVNGYSKGEGDYFWVCLNQEWRSDTTKFADHTYNWKAGQTYAIRLRGTVVNVQIDQIYITNDAKDIPHNHTWNSLKSYDENAHWWTASCHKDLTIGKAAHTFSDLKDTTCNDCNYVRPAHVCAFGESWMTSATQHWHECACGDKKDLGDHTFVNNYCSACGMLQPVKTTNGKVVIQAENGKLAAAGTENAITNYTAAPASVQNNAAASGGKTMIFNKNHSGWNLLMYWKPAEHNGQAPISHAEYYVTADVTAEHYIWLKVYAPNLFTGGAGDALFCQIDGVNAEGKATDSYYWRQPVAKADGTYSDNTSDFYWVRVHEEFLGTEAEPRNVKSYHWTAGQTYALRFRGYAAKLQIDEIYITTDPADPYVKNHEHTYASDWSTDDNFHWHAATCEHTDKVSGKGEHVFTDAADTVCDTCGKERHIHNYVNGVCACGAAKPFATQNGSVVIEVEDAVLNGTNGKIVEKADASNGKVVNFAVRNPNGNALKEDSQGDIEFTVKPDVSGQYYIWVRVTTNSVSKGMGTWIDGKGYSYQAIGSSTETGAYTWKKFSVTPTWEAGQEYKIKLGIWSFGSTINLDQFLITTGTQTPEGILNPSN